MADKDLDLTLKALQIMFITENSNFISVLVSLKVLSMLRYCQFRHCNPVKLIKNIEYIYIYAPSVASGLRYFSAQES